MTKNIFHNFTWKCVSYFKRGFSYLFNSAVNTKYSTPMYAIEGDSFKKQSNKKKSKYHHVSVHKIHMSHTIRC